MPERQYVVDEMTLRDTWRMFHIMAEFVEGFEVLPDVHPAVTIFGSARSSAKQRGLQANRQAGEDAG